MGDSKGNFVVTFATTITLFKKKLICNSLRSSFCNEFILNISKRLLFDYLTALFREAVLLDFAVLHEVVILLLKSTKNNVSNCAQHEPHDRSSILQHDVITDILALVLVVKKTASQKSVKHIDADVWKVR